MSVWRKLTRPFRVRTITVEHSEFRVRSFPPLFEHRWVPSLQERLDAKGPTGRLYLPPGEFWADRPLVVDDRRHLVGAGSMKTVIRMAAAKEEPA